MKRKAQLAIDPSTIKTAETRFTKMILIQTSIICLVRFLFLTAFVLVYILKISVFFGIRVILTLLVGQHAFDGLLFFIVDRNLRNIIRNAFASYL